MCTLDIFISLGERKDEDGETVVFGGVGVVQNYSAPTRCVHVWEKSFLEIRA